SIAHRRLLLGWLCAISGALPNAYGVGREGDGRAVGPSRSAVPHWWHPARVVLAAGNIPGAGDARLGSRAFGGVGGENDPAHHKRDTRHVEAFKRLSKE